MVADLLHESNFLHGGRSGMNRDPAFACSSLPHSDSTLSFETYLVHLIRLQSVAPLVAFDWYGGRVSPHVHDLPVMYCASLEAVHVSTTRMKNCPR